MTLTGRQNINILQRSIRLSISSFLLCVLTIKLTGQSATPQESQCFRIHVHVNGKPVDGPQVITLKTKDNESTASLEAGCFRVASALLTEKAVAVSFTVPGNKVYLAAISPDFFTVPWDIELEDKKFDRDVGLPKHTRIREACVVTFHGGEPEAELSQTHCRTRVR